MHGKMAAVDKEARTDNDCQQEKNQLILCITTQARTYRTACLLKAEPMAKLRCSKVADQLNQGRK